MPIGTIDNHVDLLSYIEFNRKFHKISSLKTYNLKSFEIRSTSIKLARLPSRIQIRHTDYLEKLVKLGLSRLETIIDLIDKSRRTRIQGEKYANEIREKRGCEPSGSEPMGCSIHGGGGWKEEERRMRGERGNGRRGRWSMLMTFGIKTSGSLDRCTRPVALINGGHQLLITRLARNCNPQRNRTLAAPLLYNGLRRYTSCVDNSQPSLLLILR